MKAEIIETAIKMLKNQGIKFSVDELAQSLRISKKTVYRYFRSKEELALAVYDKIFDDFSFRLSGTDGNKEESLSNCLSIYSEALYISNSRLLNKYSLNEAIAKTISRKNDQLWEILMGKIETEVGFQGDRRWLRLIIDSSLTEFAYSESKGLTLEPFVEIIFGQDLPR